MPCHISIYVNHETIKKKTIARKQGWQRRYFRVRRRLGRKARQQVLSYIRQARLLLGSYAESKRMRFQHQKW